MPSGPGPDWGRVETDQVVGYTDLAESTARLQRGFGSAHRGGRLIYGTWFADGLAELIRRSPVGTGAKIVLYTTIAEFGKQSVLLQCGNVVGNQSLVGLWRPGGLSSKLGVEWTLYNNVLTNNTYRWYIVLSVFPGGTARQNFAVRLDYKGNTSKSTDVHRFSAPATYTLVENIPYELVGMGFNSIKLVVNPVTAKFDKLLLNGLQVIDLSAFSVYADADTFKRPPGFLVEIAQENRVAGLNPNSAIGSILFTIDEP